MKDWRRAIISTRASVRDALAAIEKGSLQIAFAVDADGRLVGVITDGDLRRGLIGGIGLEGSVAPLLNRSFLFAGPETARDTRQTIMRRRSVKHLPIVDASGRMVSLEALDELITPRLLENAVVVMAGGRGERLAPLTRTTPKPMLPVGGRPLLETIVRGFVTQGFRRIYLSVNYMSEVIEAHFGDGSAFGADIAYLREGKRLGTAGALSLLPERPTLPFVVTNGDVLTTLDFTRLVDHHEETGADLTLVARDYVMHVPYGVVDLDDHRVTGLREKPSYTFQINAGMYVVSPEALDHVPLDEYTDMPTVVQSVAATGGRVCAYRLREYWIDIGRMEDFDRASAEFDEIFNERS